MDWFNTLSEFHFLRPLWLFAMLPALAACGWLYRNQNRTGSWEHVISPALLPLLLDRIPVKQRRSLVVVALMGWLLATLGMAGPTWERTPLPVHKQESALVILFDLSPSMLAQDLKPNRLTLARLKLIDLLQHRKEGTTALVAYAGGAFTVSPLTEDADTVAALIPALDPNIMPSRGSNVEAAAEKAIELVLNAGLTQGDLLLVTDDVSSSARETLDEIMRGMGNFRLSILGVGTNDGAPIPLSDGGFAKDKRGNIVIPKLRPKQLKSLSRRHGGRYSHLTTDESDIKYLTEGFSIQPGDATKQLERTFDSWNDQGYWAAYPLLLILLLAFRRGLLVCLLVVPILAAPQTSYAFGWDDLWNTADQQAAKAMSEGDMDKAQETFTDPQWKASAAYRNEDYETAEQLYNSATATDLYNRGNALAKAGKMEEAIQSYEEALRLSPDNDDAKFNKELVEKLLQQQQNQQQDSQDKDDSQNQQDQQKQSSNDSTDQSEQNSSDQSGQDQPNNDQQKNSPRDDDQTKANTEEENQPEPSSETNNDDNKQSEQQSEQDKQQIPQQANKEDSSSSNQEGPSSTKARQISDEEKQAMEQWLRRIPDDPGGLLREKFRYESKKHDYEQRRGFSSPTNNAEERW